MIPRFAVGDRVVHAPDDGMLVGIVRDGVDVPDCARLVEIETRGRHVRWTGLDDRSARLADLVLDAVPHVGPPREKARRALRLVHSR